MEIIILKSVACLAILMVFYKLFLEKLAIHKFKRFYLLGALVVSLIIPFITFIEYIEPQLTVPYFKADHSIPLELIPTEEIITEEPTNYLPILLWSLYGLGALLFLSKFCFNLYSIIAKINKNEKQKHNNFISVLLNDLIIPHTFFSYIFLNKTKFEAKAIPQEVILHEQTHANQKHSLDILFIELLQVIFWFNPLLYFIKKDIKLNHEFLADDAVLKQGIDSSIYQETLLQFTSNANQVPLAHAINYSLIKKRFTIMKTQTSRKAIWLRSLLLVPLLGGLLFSFSGREQVEKEVIPAIIIPKETQQTDALKLKHNYKLQIIKDGDLILNDKALSIDDLTSELDSLFFDNTKTEIKNTVITIEIGEQTTEYTLKKVKSILRGKGITKINYILKNKSISKNSTLTVNGISCDGCKLNLSKEGVEKIILGTTTGDKISTFNIKFPGKPTVNIKGVNLNAKAIEYLSETSLGLDVQLFVIKTVGKQKLSPIKITLVNKEDKNYSHSPMVKKGEASLIPPPPPPAPLKKEEIIGTEAGFIKYMKQAEANKDAIFYNGKEITAKEATAIYKKAGKIDILTQQIGHGEYRVQLSDAKGAATTIKAENLTKGNTQKLPHRQNEVQTAFVTINGSTHYKVIHSGNTKYYNRKGYLTDSNGKVLSNNPVNGDQVIPGQNISQVYKDNKVVVEFKKTGTVENTTSLHLNRKQTLEALKEDRKALLENRKEVRKAMLEERKEMLKNRRSQTRRPLYEQFKGMEANGTTFFYEGDKISEAKAIELTKENPKLNVSMQSNNGVSTVHLSKKGITTVNGKLVKKEE